MLLSAAACLLLVVATTTLGVFRRDTTSTAGGGDLTVLPGVQRFYSATVTDSPPGTVLLTAETFTGPDAVPGWSSSLTARDATGTWAGRLDPHAHGLATATAAPSPDGTLVAVGSMQSDGALTIIDARDGHEQRVTLGGGKGNVVPLDWSRDGTHVYAFATVPARGGGVGPGDLVDVDTRTGTTRLVPGAAGTNRVAPSPDGRQLFIGAPGRDRIIDPATGATLRTFHTDPKAVFDAQPWSPDGHWLVGRLGNVEIRIDVTTGAITQILDAFVQGVAWSGADTYLVVRADPAAHGPTMLTEVDVRTGRLRDVATWGSDEDDLIALNVRIARDLAPLRFR